MDERIKITTRRMKDGVIMDNYEEKRAALIEMMNLAMWEMQEPRPAFTRPFDEFRTFHRDNLIDVFRTTDALQVLGRIFKEEVA